MNNLPPPSRAHLPQPPYTASTLSELEQRFAAAGTLNIPVLSSGLFAAATTTDYSLGTNYHSTWIRDTVHIAYAHAALGKPQTAVRAAEALAQFLQTQRPRLLEVIAEPSLKQDVMRRPHIRFDGVALTELDQKWAHAQNDALGYFLWLTTNLIDNQQWTPPREVVELLHLLTRYFRAIEYWHDEDSGHWEETRKIAASSIGAVVAGLRIFHRLWPSSEIADLLTQGETALQQILPWECRQADPRQTRAYDAALLFLIYPLRVVTREMADRIIEQTVTHLQGDIGIKRYLGDSFYCTDYESLLDQRGVDPTGDFSDDLSGRDALVRQGGEAQWCLFDSTLSTIFGQRYQQRREPNDLSAQEKYFERALRQLTVDDPPRCRALQCPELYYVERGKLQTSRAVPLLWSQANLWTALESLKKSVALTAAGK